MRQAKSDNITSALKQLVVDAGVSLLAVIVIAGEISRHAVDVLE
jgi:hypothetical protein